MAMLTIMIFTLFVSFLYFFQVEYPLWNFQNLVNYHLVFCTNFIIGTPNPKLLNLIVYYSIFLSFLKN
jgi:hypothetical protein